MTDFLLDLDLCDSADEKHADSWAPTELYLGAEINGLRKCLLEAFKHCLNVYFLKGDSYGDAN